MARTRTALVVLALALAGSGAAVAGTDADQCLAARGSAQDDFAACDRALANPDLAPPQRARLMVQRALARDVLGEKDAAMTDLDDAVRLSPTDPDVLTDRASLLFASKRLDASMRDLDAALAADPRHLRALMGRAVVHSQSGDFHASRADVDRALAVDASSASPWAQRCWVGAVLADELQRTREECERALALAPKSPNNHDNLGFVHFRLGQYEKSIEHTSLAIAGAPDVASSYLVRGLAKRALGDAAGATEDLAKADALDPGVAARYAGYGVDTATP
jgi:tetratricopeptide (TPR) repeat protein